MCPYFKYRGEMSSLWRRPPMSSRRIDHEQQYRCLFSSLTRIWVCFGKMEAVCDIFVFHKMENGLSFPFLSSNMTVVRTMRTVGALLSRALSYSRNATTIPIYSRRKRLHFRSNHHITSQSIPRTQPKCISVFRSRSEHVKPQ